MALCLISMVMGAFLYAWYRGEDPPKVVTQYVTKYIDREVPIHKQGSVATPKTVYVYKTITDTVTVLKEIEIYVPRDMNEDSLSVFNPFRDVRMNNRNISIQYFNPSTRTYYINEYKTKEPDLQLMLNGDIAIIDQYHPYVGGRATLSYKKLGVMGGFYYNPFDGQVRGLYGLSYQKQIVFK
jgi:hypothetical protein